MPFSHPSIGHQFSAVERDEPPASSARNYFFALEEAQEDDCPDV